MPCRSNNDISPQIFANIENLHITGDDRGYIGSRSYSRRPIELPECLNHPRKLESITYAGRFCFAEDDILHGCKKFQSYIAKALTPAENVHFRINPIYSCSSARICAVTLKGETKVIVRGSFMRDVENVAFMICKLTGFVSQTAFRLEKIFAKLVTNVVKFDQAGRVIFESKVAI